MIEDHVRLTVTNYANRKLDMMLLSPVTEGEKQYITHLAIELVLTRENIKTTDIDFVKAILENDLDLAIIKSDSTNIKALKFLVMVKKWCHINQ